MKSVGVAALLAIFVPFLGAAYGSAAAFIVPILISIGIFVGINVTTDARAPAAPGIALLAVSVGYIISIFWAISAASSYNEELIDSQRKH